MSAGAEDLYEAVRLSKARAFDEPGWFLAEVLREEPDPWQLEGIEAIADVHRLARGLPTVVNHGGLNRLSYRSCHGPGKTHWLAQVMHWWNYCFYGKAVCTAPKEKQLRTRLWPRYRKILRGADPGYRSMIEVLATEVRVLGDEDWGCVAETASDPENMAGYHDEPQLFLVDEGSARTLDPMFPVIEGALTTPGSVLVMIGNPTRTTGEFHASHMRRGTMELYFRRHIRPEDSRFVDRRWSEAMVSKYGPDSAVVKVRVLGEFADAEENQLVALEWVERARDEAHGDDGSLPRLRVSVDVADGGEDETVITVASHFDSFVRLVRQLRFSFPPAVSPIESAKAAAAAWEEFGGDPARGDDLVVDSIGVGAGTAGYLIELGLPVVTYRGGNSSDDVKRWRNRRTQSYLVLRDAFRDGRVDIDDGFLSDEDWEDFAAQLSSVRSKPGSERVEDLETKEEMKRRGIKSPDMADSVAMQMATQQPELTTNYFEPVTVGAMEMDNYDAGLT